MGDGQSNTVSGSDGGVTVGGNNTGKIDNTKVEVDVGLNAKLPDGK